MFSQLLTVSPRLSAVGSAVLACLALAACGGADQAAVADESSVSREDLLARRQRWANDQTPPQVTVTSAPATTTAAEVTIAGTASDDLALRSVTWVNDRGGSGAATTQTVGGSATNATWSVGALALELGTNTITVTATDRAGNTTSTVATVTMTEPVAPPPDPAPPPAEPVPPPTDPVPPPTDPVPPPPPPADTTAPSVQITAAGTQSNGTLAGLSGTVADDTQLQNVAWTNDRGGSGSAALSGSAVSATWSVASIPLQIGQNVITITATDAAGNRSSTSQAVAVADPTPPADTTAPTVQVTNPGTQGNGALAGLAGTAADNAGLASVAWSSDRGGSGAATLQGTATSANWSVASIPLQTGANVITLTATDASGNKATTTTTVSVSDTTATAYPMAPKLTLSGLTGSLVTFEAPWNDTAAAPISQSAKLAKPAGALGPVVVKNGHFYVGDSRIRFYGINMSLGALTPTKAEADVIAANLAKQGFNAVRIHGFDKPYIGRTYKQQGILNNDWTTFNPTALDLFDYFMAKLMQNGIYLKVMAHTDRRYPESADCIERCEGIDNYMPELIQSHKKFVASFLGHVNPYTGKSYGADPGVFSVEINNENAITHRWRNGTIDKYVTDPLYAPKYGAELKRQWNAWLAKKFGTPAAMNTAWGKTFASFDAVAVPLRSQSSTFGVPAMTDWWKFVGDTEMAYWNGMYDYIKLTLGYKGLVSGGQMTYSPTMFKPKSDFTDWHYYWHPLPSIAGTYSNTSAPNNGYPIYAYTDNRPQYLDLDPKNTFYAASNRVKDKPHVISEFQVRANNQWRAEAEMLMFSHALFQDWDGIFLFNYSDHNMVQPGKKYGYLYNDAITKVTRIPAAAMFRRGDVLPGPNEKVYKISKERLYDRLARGQDFQSAHYDLGGNIREPFRTRISHVVVDTLAQESLPPSTSFTGTDFNTDTNQLRWKAGSSYTIDTPKSQMRTSVPDGSVATLGAGVSVQTGKTMLGRTTLTLTSMSDTQNLPAAASMLLTLTGDDSAEYEWRSADKLQRVIGVGKNRLEAVPAQVTIQKASIDTAKRLRVYALDDTGNIKLEVPVTDTGTALSFVVGPGTNSPWYLIEQK
jgi:hypothetical protein